MTPTEIIEAFGGNSKVAKMCDLTRSAVSQWRDNGIPKGWQKFLKTKRPDLFRVKKESDVTQS